MTKKTYIIENIDCANCAANIERKISALPEVEEATLTYATKQLRVAAEDPDLLLEKMTEIASAVEPGVVIRPKDRVSSYNISLHEPHHDHPEECSCENHAHEGCSCNGHEYHDSCCNGEHEHSNIPEQAQAVKRSSKSNRLTDENKKELMNIACGTVLLISAVVLKHFDFSVASVVFFVLSYIVLGKEIVMTAIRNLTHGQVFDENFLMSIATLGAFAIQEYAEGVGVMLFYRIGELFEDIAVERSRSQIMDAVDMRPDVVTRIAADGLHTIPAEEAAAGDIIQIKPGDRIPLDGTIIEGESRLDTSPVTGEPVPVTVACGDSVLSGCINSSGLLKIRVDKVLEESMVTKILDSVENAAANKPQIERFISRFARYYTPIVVLLAAGTAIIPSLITGNWSHWVYTALTFLVISCPCALVLSVPLAFFSGIGAGSKKGILFKGGVSLEAMNNIKTVVMDKTGTITKGNFILQQTVPEKGITSEELLTLCASAESTSTHPIAHSIVSAAKEKGLEITEPKSVEELAGHGVLAVLAQGKVICGNKKLMDQFHIKTPFNAPSYGTEVFVALDGIYIGRLMISDTIKDDARSAVSALQNLGIKTAMLTGDETDSANAVAGETGIEQVYARLLPQDKVTKLAQIRDENGAVMFIGDGINDAPVLAGADVGAAMGSGADAAIEAADVVFMTSNMEAIPESLHIARVSNRISKQNVVFALAVKILVMALGLFGFANMWMAVFADTGVTILCVLNSIRILYKK